MQFDTLRKSHIKRNIIIGVLVIGILATLVFSLTKAKYRVTKSIPLANGTVNYSIADLNTMAIYIQDGEEYTKADTIPESGYVLNEEESYCKVNDEVDESISLTYDTSSKTLGVSPMVSKGTKCYLYFKKQLCPEGATFCENILANNPTISTRSSFSSVLTSDTTGTIYQAEDDDGTTYYFAGDTSNNWVQFAGFYWRIIRINGDGSVRLIYNGTSNAETGTSTQLSSTSAFNSTYNRSEYVGFKYTTSSQYGTGTKSTILTALDTWYTSNLAGHEDQIELNAGFCNDRTMASGYSWSSQPSSTIYYAADDRVYRTYTPTYKCSNSNDLFTDSKATRGNKSLDNPIGLITADEVMYAGGKGATSNQNYYLYTNQNYWTLSPCGFYSFNSYAYVFAVSSTGNLGDWNVNNTIGVRPVINLKASATVSGGNGTASSPYVIN